MGGHGGLHGAGADRGSDREPANRRVLARLRPVRGPDRPASVQAGERPGDAVGSRVHAAAVGARGLAGRTGGVRRRRAAGDGQGPRGALRVRGRARPRGACRGARGAGSRAASRSARLLPAERSTGLATAGAAASRGRPGRRAAGRRSAGLLLADRRRRGDRVALRIGRPEQTGPRRRRRPRLRCGPPPTGAACRRCRPRARTWRARCWTGRSGWWADSASGSNGSRRVEGYDPVINGWKAGPDLPVRLHHEMVVTYKGELVVIGGWIPKGSDPERRDLRPRVRAARRQVGAAALPATGRARRARPPWSAIGSWSSAARPTAAWSTPPRCSTASTGATAANIPTPREHLAAASDGRLRLRGGRTRAVARQELRGARALRPRQPTAGSGCPTCRPPAAGSGPRSRAAICSRSAARARRDALGDGRVLRHRARGLVQRPRRCAPPATGSPWPRSAARSTRSAAHRDPATPAQRRRRRRSAWCPLAAPRRRAAAAWRRLPPMPTARQNMASTVLDGTIWVVGGLESRLHRLAAGRGLRPGDQRLEGRPRPAGAAAPRDGRDLQGRAGRDRRLDPEGIGPKRRGLRPRVRAARRQVGGAALAQPARARRARRPWSAIGSWSSAARPMAAWSTPPRCSTASTGATGAEHPDPARAPRGGLGRALPLRGRRTRAVARQELRGARALRPRQPTAGSDCPTCRPPAAASAPRSRTAICSRSAARPRRDVLGDGRVLRHRAQVLVERPLDAHPPPRARGGRDRPHALCARRRTATRPRERGGDRGGAQAHALSDRRPLRTGPGRCCSRNGGSAAP